MHLLHKASCKLMKIRNKNTIEEAIAIIVLIRMKNKAVVGLVFYMPGQNSIKK